ncbi:unnamed protein product, partial [Thlaspi arvense]
HKSLILDSYLDHIIDKANEIRRKNQDRFLYTNSRGGSLDSRGHLGSRCLLSTQAHSRDLGHGSSEERGDHEISRTSPMANHFTRGLAGHGSVAISCTVHRVREKEFECGKELSEGPPPELRGEDGGNSITLSDGLWSCCGSERIFVFTTNHIEKLDPALRLLRRCEGGGRGGKCVEGSGREQEGQGKALSELLEALKTRADRIRVNGGLRNSGDVEEEEQERGH